MFRYLLLVLLWLPVAAQAQCVNCKKTSYSMVFKFDATGLLRKEYRLTMEKTFWDRMNLSWFLTAGVYNYSNEQTATDRLLRTETFDQAWNQAFAKPRDPFRLNTLPFRSGDSAIVREDVNGTTFRAGLRKYLTHISPFGFFLELTGKYSNFGNAYYDASGTQVGGSVTMAPGGGAALGYQYLFGSRGQWAFDFYGGLDYQGLTRNTTLNRMPHKEFGSQFTVHAGLQLGLAFHR